MTPDPDRHDALHNNRRPLAMNRVRIMADYPHRIREQFTGASAEHEADDYLHRLSLQQSLDGGGVMVNVEVELSDGHRVSNVHFIMYGETAGSVRSQIMASIEGPMGVPSRPATEELRRIRRGLSLGCHHRHTVTRLLQFLRQPPPNLDEHGPEAESGYAEHQASLFHSLEEGISAQVSLDRARRVAMEFAPPAVGRWEYAVGVWTAQLECRRILAGRPPRPGGCGHGA